MGELAEFLSAMYRGLAAAGDVALPWMIDRPVIDAIGLSREYNFELDYGPHRGDAPNQQVT